MNQYLNSLTYEYAKKELADVAPFAEHVEHTLVCMGDVIIVTVTPIMGKDGTREGLRFVSYYRGSEYRSGSANEAYNTDNRHLASIVLDGEYTSWYVVRRDGGLQYRSEQPDIPVFTRTRTAGEQIMDVLLQSGAVSLNDVPIFPESANDAIRQVMRQNGLIKGEGGTDDRMTDNAKATLRYVLEKNADFLISETINELFLAQFEMDGDKDAHE